MTPRHLVLAITAAVVLAMGVYLFVAVRSSPAEADVSAAPPPQAPTATVQVGQGAHPSETASRSAPVRPSVAMHPSEPTVTATATQTDDRDSGNEPPIDDMLEANVKLEAIMDRANKAYDRQDFDEAKSIAIKVLGKQPGNVRMLRILVSSSCIDGDTAIATKYFPQLPKFDREQMKMRCDRYGVTLTDPQ